MTKKSTGGELIKSDLECTSKNKSNILFKIVQEALEKGLCKEDDKFKEFERDIAENKEQLNNLQLVLNTEDNTTPIHYIMRTMSNKKNAHDILEVILKNVDNYRVLEVRDSFGMTALDCAIYLKEKDAVKSIFKRNMDLRQKKGLSARNIIHFQYAIMNENITYVEIKNLLDIVVNEVVEFEIVEKELSKLEKIKLERMLHEERKTVIEEIINNNDICTKQSLLHTAIMKKNKTL